MVNERVITSNAQADPLVCSEFREGRSYTNWRPRGSGDWLLIFTLAGRGRVTAAGKVDYLSPGDAVLFAPGARQDYSTDETTGHWHLRWAHFRPRPHWRTWLLWPELAPGTGKVSTQGAERLEISSALQRMLLAYRIGGDGGSDLAMNALEEALIRCARLSPRIARVGVDDRVRRAVRYLAAHSGEPFQLNLLAAHCGLSSSRLSHLFREELGTSPQRFSEKLRLDCARDLLMQTNLSIFEVAAEVGFNDPLYFSRRYRLTFGYPPRLQRLQRRAAPRV